MEKRVSKSGISRRGFMRLTGGAATLAMVGGCGGGGSEGGADSIAFWNMQWGRSGFTDIDKGIVDGYTPVNDMPRATYQSLQWAGFTQVFAAAVASNTTPAASSGGSTQAFQFEAQDKIAYADGLAESWKQDGLYDDFLPNVWDVLKTERGFAAIPYNVAASVLWYNKPLLEKADVEPPTDWQSYIDACAALKKIGVYGYGGGTGAGNLTGANVLRSLMINNGGGFFDENQRPNCVTDENIEAMEFVLEMVSKGYVDPAAVTYTSANVDTQWKEQKFGMGFNNTGFDENVGGTVGANLVVGTPLVSASGKKGSSFAVNNIMMYKNTPSQAGTEAFLTYYYKNIAPLWTKPTGLSGLPPLKSITETKEFQAKPNNVKAVSEWLPVARTAAAPGSDAMFAGLSVLDSTPALLTFAQDILGGRKSARDALQALQDGIK